MRVALLSTLSCLEDRHASAGGSGWIKSSFLFVYEAVEDGEEEMTMAPFLTGLLECKAVLFLAGLEGILGPLTEQIAQRDD